MPRLFPELIAGELDPGSASAPSVAPSVPSGFIGTTRAAGRGPALVLDHGIDRIRRDEALLNEERLERGRPHPRLVEVVAVGHARSR